MSLRKLQADVITAAMALVSAQEHLFDSPGAVSGNSIQLALGDLEVAVADLKMAAAQDGTAPNKL